MRIDQIAVAGGARPRLSARITWEDSDREPHRIGFETDAEFGDALACRPEPFLVAAIVPAMWAGERRLSIEGEVCPELLENLHDLMQVFRHWFSPRLAPVAIEAVPRRARDDRGGARTGVFFSGGLDSLAAVAGNRAAVPPGHPASVKDGIIVYGLEVEQDEPFQHVLGHLRELARDAGVTLLPVSTDIRSLNPDWFFWWHAYMGAALAAVGHALGRRLGRVVIASDYDVPNIRPHGSHPLVEPNFSSHELRVRYDGIALTRLEKARLVSRWPAAMAHLRVCNRPELYRSDRVNCGACEKCVRTMLEMVAAGADLPGATFGGARATPDLVAACDITDHVAMFYEELVEPLRRAGRDDLARAIVQRLRQVREETWKGRLRRFDREWLHGRLWRARRALGAPGPARVPSA